MSVVFTEAVRWWAAACRRKKSRDSSAKIVFPSPISSTQMPSWKLDLQGTFEYLSAWIWCVGARFPADAKRWPCITLIACCLSSRNGLPPFLSRRWRVSDEPLVKALTLQMNTAVDHICAIALSSFVISRWGARPTPSASEEIVEKSGWTLYMMFFYTAGIVNEMRIHCLKECREWLIGKSTDRIWEKQISWVYWHPNKEPTGD